MPDIDVDAIEQAAAQIDLLAAESPEPEKKRKRKARQEQEPEEMNQVESVPDPEFQAMITAIVDGVIFEARKRLEWTDPGPYWKQKVASRLASIQERLTGKIQEGIVADLLTIGGYAAIWIVPNVAFRDEPQSDTDRNNGKREDVQTSGTFGT